ERHVAAEADIGLLTYRHETRIAGEQIPQLRKRHIVGHFGDQPHVAGIAPPRQRDQRGEDYGRQRGKDAARPGDALDADCLDRSSHLSPSSAETARWGAESE